VQLLFDNLLLKNSSVN